MQQEVAVGDAVAQLSGERSELLGEAPVDGAVVLVERSVQIGHDLVEQPTASAMSLMSVATTLWVPETRSWAVCPQEEVPSEVAVRAWLMRCS